MPAACARSFATAPAWRSSAPASSARRSPPPPARPGAEVTIVEALPAPLAGVLGEEVGLWLMKMHDEEGVDVRLSTKLEGARGNGAVEELVLSGGDRLACDAVVVGIGVAPARRLAEGERARDRRSAHRPCRPHLAPRCLGRGRRGQGLRPSPRRAPPHRALGRGRPPGNGRRTRDHRRGAGPATAAELLERPVRAAHPVRRPRRGRRRRPRRGQAGRPRLRRRLHAGGEARSAPWSSGRPRAFARLRKEIERTYDERTNGKEKR